MYIEREREREREREGSPRQGSGQTLHPVFALRIRRVNITNTIDIIR